MSRSSPARWSGASTIVALRFNSSSELRRVALAGRAAENADPLAAEILEIAHRLAGARNHARAVDEGRQGEVDDFPARQGDELGSHRMSTRPSRTASKRRSAGTRTYCGLDVGSERRRHLDAEIDDVAGRLAVGVLIGIGLGVGAVADPEHAGIADAIERRGGGGGLRQDG